MAEKPSPDAPDRAPKKSRRFTWKNVCVSEYPGADGKPKFAKPGDLISDAATGWPPDQVVRDGWVLPASLEQE